jgi:hypothetical protein
VKSALALVAALLPLAAAASYPVEVEEQMNGLRIKVLSSAGVPLVITFVSEDKADATCRAEVASGLDTPQERTASVKAGRTATIQLRLVSAPNRVRVKVACRPAAVKSDRKP